MSASPSRPGAHPGLFRAASIGLLVFAAVHLLAAFSPPSKGPQVELMKQMQAVQDSLGPFTFSAWGLFNILSHSYTVLLLQTGVINLIALRPAAAHGLLGRLAIANAIFASMLAAVSLIMQFPPPLVFSLVVTLLFIASAVLRPRPAISGT